MNKKLDFSLEDIVTSFENPEEIFEVLEQLGEGSYGSVFKALHKETGQIVALKIVPIAGETESLKKEIAILKSCQNEYIVKYFGSYFQNLPDEKNLWLVMEYCAAGSVIDLLRTIKKTLSEE